MNVFGRRRTAVWGVACDAVVYEQQLSSHSEVNQENATAFEPNNQILAAAIHGSDPLPLELGGHSGGVFGPGEAWVGDLDVLEAATDELGLEPRPDGLDLGKLRHGARVAPQMRSVAVAQAMTSMTTPDSGGGSSASR